MKPKIFISYKWGGESEQIAAELEKALLAKGLNIVRDKTGGLDYKGLIREFMQKIGQGNFVVVILSDGYLKSENCMFELIEIAKNGDFLKRVYPLILADANIFKAKERVNYLKHWEQEVKDLNEAITGLQDIGDISDLQQEIDLYKNIRKEIAGLTGKLKNMNTLTSELHQRSGFQELYNAIEAEIKVAASFTAKEEELKKKVVKATQNEAFTYDVFISFSSKDEAFVKKVSQELRAYNLRLFVSNDSLHKASGKSFLETIDTALQQSEHFLLISTPTAMQSMWVKQEYEAFFSQCHLPSRGVRRLMILKGKGFQMGAIPSLLRNLQFNSEVKDLVQILAENPSKPLKIQSQESQKPIQKTSTTETPKKTPPKKESIEKPKEEKTTLHKPKQEVVKPQQQKEKTVSNSTLFKILGGIVLLFLVVWGIVKIFEKNDNQQSLTEDVVQVNDTILTEDVVQVNDTILTEDVVQVNDTINNDSKTIDDSITESELSDNIIKRDSPSIQRPTIEKPNESRKEKIVTVDKKREPKKNSKNKSYTETINGVSFKMIYVEGGKFDMGDTFGDGYEHEKPVHEVELSDYFMGETEVTQELYEAVMGKNPSNFKNCTQCPVEKVSWNDAQAFIKKLNQTSQYTYRLPTEAEWEFAARGGIQAKNTKWAGVGNEGSLTDYAWIGKNSNSKTHSVKQKKPNELGLYDMSGNVWEWCADWYDKGYYAKSAKKNPQGANSGDFRVLRGGSWNYLNLDNDCRVSNRDSYYPSNGDDGNGFRLSRD